MAGAFFCSVVSVPRVVALQLIPLRSPALNAALASGGVRGMATAIGHGQAAPPAVAPPAEQPLVPGRVTSSGTWRNDTILQSLADLLGPSLAPALRPTFAWHLCRGAFFHNDAHFEDVLFGVWCLTGPPAEIAFPRAGVRLPASPGHVVVFDPFEVHGVVAPGRTIYAAGDYEGRVPSLFIGFELALNDAVAREFRVPAPSAGRTISSRSRIAADTGAFE